MSICEFRERAQMVALLALITAFAWLSDEAMRSNAIMVDEFAHLPAGISYWELGQFYIYRENPPLVQCLEALPAWLSGARMDYSRAGLRSRSELDVGADFLNANTEKNQRYFVQARSVIAILAIVCGVLMFRWSRELYGSGAAIVCAALWFLDPNVLAHSGVVTTDIGAAMFGCLATYLFWLFLRFPTRKNALIAGLGLGLAEGSKFSLLALYPAWLIIFAFAHISRRNLDRAEGARGRASWLQLSLIGAMSLVVLNALYNFEGTLKSLGSFDFKSGMLTGQATREVASPPFGNRFRDTPLAGLPVPLPKNYLLGLDSQKWEEEIGFANLSGDRLVRGGRWYSPLRTLAYKLPPGTLLLLVASGLFTLVHLRRPRLEDVILSIPALAMLILLCTQLGLNWVFRYSLIALPYLVISVGRPVQALWAYRSVRLAVAACLLLNASAVLGVRPNYLSYGNELVGGPLGAQRVFLGSNFDWGQDLIRLKEWCDGRPDVLPIAVSYYGVVDPGSVGLKVRGLALSYCRAEAEGRRENVHANRGAFYWAISSNILNGLPGGTTLEDGTEVVGTLDSPLLKPGRAVARVGYSIYIFRIGAGDSDPSTTAIAGDELGSCLVSSDRDFLSITP